MSFWIGVLVVAVGLLVSIALHEVGHLLPAKKFGVRVPQYFVGFGPTLWSRRRGETEYGVKAIPLGGFVRMVGMFPPAKHAQSEEALAEDRLRRRGIVGWARSVTEDARAASLEELQPGDDKRAFYQLSTPKKLVVMMGGPLVNLILSALLFGIVFSGIGLWVGTSTISAVTPCIDATQTDCSGSDEAPSTIAGFEPGDVIVSWGGTPVQTWSDVSTAITEGGTEATEVVVERGGATTTLTVTPTLIERSVTATDGTTSTAEVPYVGISPTQVRERQPLGTVAEVVGQQFTATVGVVLSLPRRLVSIAQSVFSDTPRDPSIVGVIGVGRAAGDLTQAAAPSGFLSQLSNLLIILASLNMALFVFNLIPLPPLDGGHVAGALYEGARRQLARWRHLPNPGFADTAKLMPLTYAVFVVLLGMGVLLAVADIVKPVVIT